MIRHAIAPRPLAIAALVLLSGFASVALAAEEAEYTTLDALTPPDGARLEVGGLDFLSDGRLVVSTRRGQVWIVENALADDPSDARFTLFAEGLHEGLGLEIVDDDIYVLQRGELSRLVDTDEDGRCDTIHTVCDDWGLSGNYHEFAFGLPRDDAGNFYLGLNVGFFDPWWHGRSVAKWRGWVVRVKPDGTAEGVAPGFRSPCGLGRNRAGDIFVTDNQGDWMPSSPVFHLQDGNFYGHPASLDWTAEYQAADKKSTDTDPPAVERAPAAVWLPYGWSRSTGNLVFDDTGGEFGPFDDQLFIAELTNGHILRASLEKVRGEYQGAVFMFRSGVGSAVRARFAPDGSLFIGRTNRGWGGQAPGDGIGRLRPTGKLPMEMRHVHLLQDGFEIEFTRPLAASCNPAPEDVSLVHFDYNYWWEYGSPEMRTRDLAVESVSVNEDRTKLTLRIPGLRPGKVARGILSNIVGEGDIALLHDEFNYTINQLPEGPRFQGHVARLVPPPAPIEHWNEGWFLLTDGALAESWNGEGWQIVDPNTHKTSLDVTDPSLVLVREVEPDDSNHRWRELVHDGSTGSSTFTSRFEHPAIITNIDFFLPKGGSSSVYLQGRYELRLRDTKAGARLTRDDCGGVGEGAGFAGRPPKFNAYNGAGKWHTLTVRFLPPQFDAEGKKILNARFLRVRINDVLLHENVELPGPSASAPFQDEAATGPMVLRAGSNGAAFRRISVKPIDAVVREPNADDGFEPLFHGIDLDGWTQMGEADWTVEEGGVIHGSGKVGHLFSPRGDYRNFELRAEAKIGDDSNSGLYFRTTLGDGWPAGYEAQINATYDSDPVKTGSLYGRDAVQATVVSPGVWFRYHVTCRDEEKGTRIIVRVNDIVTVNFLDTERTHTSGHVALQQHHEGSDVWFRNLAIRELP